MVLQSSPNRARYLRSRSESLIDVLCVRETSNRRRPASLFPVPGPRQSESKQCVYIQRIEQNQEPHINFVFSDKSAFDAVRFRHFYQDCKHIAKDTIELDTLAKQEQKAAVKFLDKNYNDILDNYDPSVIRLRKKRKIILADGVLDDLL